MKDKNWAQRMLTKQGQICFSRGTLGGEWKAKAVNWVQIFSINAVWWLDEELKKPKGFFPSHFWKW